MYISKVATGIVVFSLSCLNAGWAQSLQLSDVQGSMDLQFLPELGYSYTLFSSPDLKQWSHIASLRDGIWQLPASELGYFRRFYRINKVVPLGDLNTALSRWNDFKLGLAERYHIGLIGDSYTHSRERYPKRLKRTLAARYGNLGAGYLSFAEFTSGEYRFPNGSVDETELSYDMPEAEWIAQYGDGYGADSCHMTSAITNAKITINVLLSVERMHLYYAKKPNGGGFRYRVRGGAWAVVDTADVSLSLGIEVLDLEEYDAPYDLEVETLASGVTMMGAEAIKSGNGVAVHKLGATGKKATSFVTNSVARDLLGELNLDMGIILFGTNEQGGNQSPVVFKAALENICSSLRSNSPLVELVLIVPCYTKYESEDPRAYKLEDYRNAMIEVAVAFDDVLLDLTEVFGPEDALQDLIDTGLMASDRIHPSTSGVGAYVIADAISYCVLQVGDL